MTLRLIGDFKADGELKRQLNNFERNVRAETDSLRAESGGALRVVGVAATEQEQVAPGEALGVDSEGGDVTILLTKPRPEDAGKFTVIYKRTGTNSVFSEPIDSKVNGSSAAHTRATVGATIFFCDGEGYWT